MSNGSGPIIIHSLQQAATTTVKERGELLSVLERYKVGHRCDFRDALFVLRLVWRAIR